MIATLAAYLRFILALALATRVVTVEAPRLKICPQAERKSR